MRSQCIADQGGTVDLEPPRRPISRAKKILFNDDLNRVHMWSVLHTTFHVKIGGPSLERRPASRSACRTRTSCAPNPSRYDGHGEHDASR